MDNKISGVIVISLTKRRLVCTLISEVSEFGDYLGILESKEMPLTICQFDKNRYLSGAKNHLTQKCMGVMSIIENMLLIALGTKSVFNIFLVTKA